MTSSTTLPAPAVQPAEPKTRWYRRPWIAPLMAICAIFLILRVPDYVGLDSSNAILDLQGAFPETHYMVLSFHVIFGSIAMVTCCMQVWPWLRTKHPRVHRISGRLYVLAGVLPSGILALVVSVIAVQQVPGIIGNVMLSLLWLGTTHAGFAMARKRKFVEHRRWMLRSFALCMSIVANRVWLGIWVGVLMPFSDTLYGGDFDALLQDAIVTSIWTSWVVNLLIVQWWIDRKPKRRKAAPERVA